MGEEGDLGYLGSKAKDCRKAKEVSTELGWELL